MRWFRVYFEYKNNRQKRSFVNGNLLVVVFITSIMIFSMFALPQNYIADASWVSSNIGL